MSSRRHHRSSSRSSQELPALVRGEGHTGSRRRRRRNSSWRRLERRLKALLFGFALFGVAGGLILFVFQDKWGSTEAPSAPGPTAGTGVFEAAPSVVTATPARTGQPDNPVAVVTCPGAEKRSQNAAYAAACGDSAALKELLSRPGTADAPDPRPEFAGRTALHHAAQRGDTTMVTTLLAAGANPNKADAAGDTPLHLVVSTSQLGNPEFVAHRLIEGGARLDMANRRGLTPIQDLEVHHERLLHRQDLAKVLYQAERDGQLAEWTKPPPPANDSPFAKPGSDGATDSMVELDTSLGRVRIPVDPPSPDGKRKTP